MSLSGHHSNYLEHIAELFLSQGHRVSVSVRGTETDHPVLLRLGERHTETLRVEALPPARLLDRWLAKMGVAGGEVAAWRALRRLFRSLDRRDPVDRVFYPYVDYCLHACALFGPPSGSAPWAGICMRPSFHLHRSGVVAPMPKFASAKEWLFHRLLTSKGLQALFTIDELLWRNTSATRPQLASRLHFLADPARLGATMDRSKARDRLGLEPDDFAILVYGSIDDRKGVHLLLNSLRNQTFAKQVRVLVVGKHSAAMRQSLANEPLVTSLDGYADETTEESAFRAADLVWLGYRSHYAMSGVLVLAAIAGVRVIASHKGLIGWMTREHELGDAIEVEQTNEVTECIRRHIGATAQSPSSGMAQVKALHTWSEALRRISLAFKLRDDRKE